jgi:hypothetical protein
MAGILDKKTRFVDTFLTDQGRQELSKGELRFSFAVFSDYGTFYDSSVEDPSIASDVTKRLQFEAANRHQDLVIPEFDADGGMLYPAAGFDLVNGQLMVLEGSESLLKGQSLVDNSALTISDSMQSFVEMMPLRTEESIQKTTGFKISVESSEFVVNQHFPISQQDPKEMFLENVESLWQDKKLTHVPNFQFLPPVNKISGKVLDDFPRLQQPTPLTYRDLLSELEGISPGEWSGVGPPINVKFDRTSPQNNLVCQVWEITSSSINKLRMIDFGEFADEDPFSSGKHVFFVGKLLDDDTGDKTFLNLFTVVFD